MRVLRVLTLPMATAALLAGCGNSGLPTETDQAGVASFAQKTIWFHDDLGGGVCPARWPNQYGTGGWSYDKYDHNDNDLVCYRGYW